MNWEQTRFKDFITLQRGNDLTRDEMNGGDYPVVGSNSVIGYHTTFLQNPPGVVTGRSGSLGEVQFINVPFWAHNTALWVKDFKGNEPKFVFYKLQTLDLARFNGGGAVPTLNRNNLDNVRVKVPPLPTQRKIAGILSAYDDLIENNLKRIQLLEESARLLYREWFVRLRFPGHEHTPINNGIPQGWEKKTLAEVCESVNYGYTASAQQEEIGVKFLRITDIVPSFIDWSNVPYCEIPDNKKEQFLLKQGDIVIARTGATVGYAKRLHKRHPATVFASYLVRLRVKKEIDDLMIGLFVESDDYKSFVQSNLGGAAQPNANAKVLSSAKILIPPPLIQKLFRETVEASFDQREVLQQQNQKLKQARDLLLPRLMSGEIAV